MCKIKVGNNFIPLFAYLDNYGDVINDTELGAKIIEAYEACKRSSKVKEPIRAEEGAKLKEQRERLHISRRVMGEWIGVSEQTVANMEKGKPVQSPNMMTQAYKHGLKYIPTKSVPQ